MSSKDRFQKRARAIQKDTGWSYGECLRLSREGISEEGLAALKQMRAAMSGPRYEVKRIEGTALRTAKERET